MMVPAVGGHPRQLQHKDRPLSPAVSPRLLGDNRSVVFLASMFIWTMDLQALRPRRIEIGAQGASSVAPTIDGKSVYFTREAVGQSEQQGLWRVDIDGAGHPGTPYLLMQQAAASVPTQIVVSREGSSVAFSMQNTQSALWTIPIDSSGTARAEATRLLPDVTIRTSQPRFSPKGSMLAFLSHRAGEAIAIRVSRADGSDARNITDPNQNYRYPSWLEGGRCAYVDSARAVWIAPLNGPPQRLNHRVKGGWPHITRDGMRLVDHLRDPTTNRMRLVIEDLRSGEVRDLTPLDRSIGYATWAPDQRWIVAEEESGVNSGTMVLVSPENGRIEKLATETDQNFPHSWSPDGDRIAFAGRRDGVWNIYWISRSTGRVQQLTHYKSKSGFVRYPEWSPHGEEIVFERYEFTANIYVAEVRK